ncbi:MAG: WxL domain-containing protein [Enterococcus lacertideformus]|uniref:WxL domain-containing protein n=1 Tax=Enterococcus lacertideformus TaxID=2771493 RepID=A0A931FA36_9ENTE|nr:WxL domain-containing protein [Enterococcus lacertideformus]
MKKCTILLLLGSGIGVVGGVQETFAMEANPTAVLTSDASLNIQGGILSLDTVSNFDFGDLTIKEIAEADQELTSIPEATTISDYRGPNDSGWMLTASLSAITNEKSVTLQSVKLNLAATRTAGAATIGTIPAIDAGTTDPTLVATANGTTGLATNTFDFTETTLTFPKQNINSGQYTGVVTWTLTNAYKPA